MKQCHIELRMRSELYVRNRKTLLYGRETMSFLFRKIWAMIPQNVKDYSSLTCFKMSIRKQKPNFPFRLYKAFKFYIIQQLLPFLAFNLFEVHVACSYSQFIFILHIVCKNYSWIIQSGICFDFQNLLTVDVDSFSIML